MCGIVGYIGKGTAKYAILKGLESLEYRGYDSAGIALMDGKNIFVEKKQGKLENLEKALENVKINSNIGIGHTRWATHGAPSDRNSHPHLSMDGNFAVVHNGIIENYIFLKKQLEEKGYIFKSDTDTEVIAHLLQENYLEKDPKATLLNVLDKLEGSYALGIVSSHFPDMLLCARKNSPLVVGTGINENLIASDVPALLNYTRNVYYLDNNEIGILSKDDIKFYNANGYEISKESSLIQWSLEQASKNGFDHFMLKEIYEQPSALIATYSRIVKNHKINFDSIFTKDDIEKYNKIYIVACGTAYHAGLIGKVYFNNISQIEVLSEIASEFRYTNPFVDEKTLVIFVSQSGETLDTLEALKEAKRKGATTLAITNVVGSTISREAHKVIYTMAGPEIAVASTKAYTTQVLILYLLALYIGLNKKNITFKEFEEYLKEFENIPRKIEEELKNSNIIKEIAEKIKNKYNGFFIGRGLDYQIALEGCLKMKEITYIHTEAFPSGELKHGSIALIEEGTPVIVLATQKNLIDKTISNIKELKARGAYVITLGEDNNFLREVSDEFIIIKDTVNYLSVYTAIIPLQLLAYYTSIAKGIDVDKPRNLAKSVTVE